MNQFIIKPLNVGHGESSFLHICQDDREFNLLVDGGSYRKSKDSHEKPIDSIETVKEVGRKNVLHGLVVSHVDDDHIGGLIHLLKEWKKTAEERNFFLIFNDYIDHTISFTQGEQLINEVKQLQKKENVDIKLINTYSKRYVHVNDWIQKNLDTLPVYVQSIFQRKMLAEKKKNTVYITLLTPGKKEINDVMQEWKKDKINRTQGKRSSYNGKIVNKSSISFLIEYNCSTVLLTGDTSIELIRDKLEELSKQILQIDYINLCHHGAADNNKGILEMVERYKCRGVFASTNSVTHPEHPDMSTLCELLREYPKLIIYLTNDLLPEDGNGEMQKTLEEARIAGRIINITNEKEPYILVVGGNENA